MADEWVVWIYYLDELQPVLPNSLVTGIISHDRQFCHYHLVDQIYPYTTWSAYLLITLCITVFGRWGIGQVVFFVPAWLVATRIHKLLGWWQKLFPFGVHKALATAWLGLLVTASVLILMGLIVAIFGYIPMDRVLNITLSMVRVSLGCFLLAFVAGFARDITQRV